MFYKSVRAPRRNIEGMTKAALSPFSGCIASRYLSVYHNVTHAITSKAVGTMKSAGYLAGGIKSWYFCSVGSQHVHVLVNLYSAHGVVNGWSNAYGIVWSHVQRGGHLRR